MKKAIKLRQKTQQGFLVVEILLCLVIAGSILISSGNFLSSIFNKISQEDYHHKIHNYANHALSDIGSTFVIANNIEISGYNNENTITLQTSAGEIKYSINDETGILKSIRGGSDKLIGAKTSNQLFSTSKENHLFSFDIIEFSCEKINSSDGETYGGSVGDNEQHYKNSFFQLNLAFKLYFKNELIDVIEFERKFFSPKAFIKTSRNV